MNEPICFEDWWAIYPPVSKNAPDLARKIQVDGTEYFITKELARFIWEQSREDKS